MRFFLKRTSYLLVILTTYSALVLLTACAFTGATVHP